MGRIVNSKGTSVDFVDDEYIDEKLQTIIDDLYSGSSTSGGTVWVKGNCRFNFTIDLKSNLTLDSGNHLVACFSKSSPFLTAVNCTGAQVRNARVTHYGRRG